MTLAAVRRKLMNRLDEGDRGDRGWFVITRVHVATSWLKGITEYLESRGGASAIHLTGRDYARLATIIETTNRNPGVQLRRHHLLVMDKPLQLLQRVDGRSWDRIVLTERGRALANADDPAQVLEQSLYAIRFAVAPWSPRDRVTQYSDFNVHVYRAMKRVLEASDGHVDRNEFDFFVSRIRTQAETNWAIEAIMQYRELRPDERDTLHREVRTRIPGVKAYSNWRDIGLHTFSLFSLGTSMVREGTRLLSTSEWVGRHAKPPADVKVTATSARQLRMPEPPETNELLTPPAAPASNDGADGESFVAKVLRAQGWEVAFYTNRRGYGFDLWARRGNRAMVIEVKSSLGALGAVTLTPTEYQAAKHHGDSYILALVEHTGSDAPVVRMIQNPLANLTIDTRTSTTHLISRTAWLRVATN